MAFPVAAFATPIAGKMLVFELNELSAHGAVFRSGRAYKPPLSSPAASICPPPLAHGIRGLLVRLPIRWLDPLFESVSPRQTAALRAIARMRSAVVASQHPWLN